jgi:hypothetical protein
VRAARGAARHPDWIGSVLLDPRCNPGVGVGITTEVSTPIWTWRRVYTHTPLAVRHVIHIQGVSHGDSKTTRAIHAAYSVSDRGIWAQAIRPIEPLLRNHDKRFGVAMGSEPYQHAQVTTIPFLMN